MHASKILNIRYASAGLTAVVIGYTGSVIIIIQAAMAAGATTEQITSWLLALGIAMGVTSIGFSLRYKIPVLMAWSTPGAAMLIGVVDQYDLTVSIGAFVMTGLMIALTGCFKPVSRMIQSIPQPMATAMLAAIVLPFCMNAFLPAESDFRIFVVMLAAFLLAKRWLPKYVMILLLLAGLGIALWDGVFAAKSLKLTLATPVLVYPEFTLSGFINISIPLYLVTMLSQNLPGMAMLRSYNYSLPLPQILIGSGVTNAMLAPIGGFSVNLAAISAAACMNEDVDADPSLRYRSTIWAGLFYLLAGVWATAVVTLFLALPEAIGQMMAGFAVLGTLLMCLQNAFNDARYHEAALITFLVTVSGVTLFGIGSTLWGLVVGGLFYLNKKKH
ncbi:benzoate/H(+) symporter BenE family transporter [Endozoicomonas montiporae]|uniref:benzoate/H(+) symporter BenE family transporter n=1 Tax=Endozoicomonas montiporae TaxID=1027273 RepID=UPI001C9DE374|nr:benzoate/H(+) symporter BenE family transporter [Endozoicomonas montiporae]